MKNKDNFKVAEKWSKEVIGDGWTPIPNLLLMYQVRLQLKPQHICVLAHLLSYWWGKERNPFPSVKTLAERIGIQSRQVRRYFEQLEKEIVIEVQGQTIKGLVKRVDRFHESKGRTSNEYDLSNLLLALKLIAQERDSLSGNLKARNPNKKILNAVDEIDK